MLTEFARSWPNFHRHLPEAVRRWPSVNLWPLSLHPINQSHDDAKCLGASFFFLLFLRQNHTVSGSKRILSLFFLSLSLPRKFTRRKPADGRDRRIRGYFRWFGSIRSAVSHSKHESVELFLVFTFPPPSSASFHLRPSHIARAGRVGMFRFWNLRVIPTTDPPLCLWYDVRPRDKCRITA